MGRDSPEIARDVARLAQFVARAHRMGATAPVLVEPMLLWDD